MNNHILITGAAGEIGRVLRAGLYDGKRRLRLLDIIPREPARDGEEVVTVNRGYRGYRGMRSQQ